MAIQTSSNSSSLVYYSDPSITCKSLPTVVIKIQEQTERCTIIKQGCWIPFYDWFTWMIDHSPDRVAGRFLINLSLIIK
jgi:hypothetical protein